MLPQACLPYLVGELRSSRHNSTSIVRGEVSEPGAQP
jgi:hypothetical protein